MTDKQITLKNAILAAARASGLAADEIADIARDFYIESSNVARDARGTRA